MKQKKILIIGLFFALIFNSNAQSIRVKGKVSDNLGGMPGVNVLVKGSIKSTSTDFDGSFQIEVLKGTLLTFSFVGYNSQTIAANSEVLNIILKSDTRELETVVITSFGVKSKTRSLGYSTQTIKAAEVDRPGQVNAFEALQGSVAGLSINRTSGAAGAGADILIRGVSSLNATSNNQPLIILDGNPINNSTSSGSVNPSIGSNSAGSSEQFAFSNRGIDINPNDIESYTILKGAGATALYGILGGNGVIIITTKKGKEGKAKVNISTNVSFNTVNKYPELQSTWREGTTAGNSFPSVLQPRVLSNDANTPSGVSYYPGFSFGFQTNGPKYSSSDDSSISFRNFYKDFFKTGLNTTLNVSLSGGTDKFNYFLSGSTSKDSGIIPNTDYNKKTFRMSGEYKVSDKLKVSSSITFTNSGGRRANNGDKSIMSSLSYWSPSIDINSYLNASGKQKNWTDGIIDNPRYFAETSNLTDNVDRIVASLELNWDAKSWLNVLYRASIDNFNESRNRYVPGDLDVGTQVGGFIVDSNSKFRALNSLLLITGKKSFGNINTSLSFGNQITDNNSIDNYLRGETLLVDGFNSVSENTLIKFAFSSGEQIERNVGIFSELKLDYKELFFIGATARKDRVSTLPLSNNNFNYFSINGALVFTDFVDPENKILSYGKLRTSWAQVGKIPPYGLGRASGVNSNFPFAGVSGISIGSVDVNKDIVAEIVTTKEYGADLSFLKRRLRIDYTYFDRLSENQIIPLTPSFSSSLSKYWTNAGALSTKGHELSISADIIKKTNYGWTATLNYTANKSEVLSLPDGLSNIIFADSGNGVTSEIRVGDAAGSLYGYTWKYLNGQRFIDTNGKPVLDTDANGAFKVSKVGNAFPDYVLTMNNNFKIHNFNLAFLFEYKKGGSSYDAGQRNGIRNGVLAITDERNVIKVLDGVKANGAPNDIPTLINSNSYYRNINYNRASEILVQDASWVKLRNISLTYNLASKVVSKLKIGNLSFTVSGNNFLVWTPFRGFDPEGNQFSAGSNTFGFTGLNVPLTKSYSFSVNLGL